MRETISRMWTQIREWIAAMPRGRKIQISVLSVVVITLAIVAVSLMTATTWARLPVSDPSTTPQVYEALRDMGVNYRVEGNNIMVPEENLSEITMQLRAQNILGVTDFDFSLMDGATGFGITDAHARRIYDADAAERIRTILIQSPRIQNALIILNSGETSPFRIASNARQATASVMLTISGGGRLSNTEVQTIGELVRNAIPGIEYDNITISDNDFNFYRVGEIGQDLGEEIDTRFALQKRYTDQLQISVEQLLSPIYGFSNIQVQPHVKLNFDKRITEQVEYFPPIAGELDGIVRSIEEIYRLSRSWADPEGIPGTDTNNMGTGEYPWGDIDERDLFRELINSRNYEINETRQMIEHEQGYVESTTISVLINADTEGIDEDYTAQVTDLVSKAVNVNPSSIAVHILPFANIDSTMADMYASWEAEQAAARNRELLNTILQYAVIVLLGVMVMMLVRTIVIAVKPPPEPEPILMAAGPEGVDYLIDDEEPGEMEFEDVDLTQKSPGLEQIERFIDKDSASVAQLLRNWLGDD